MDILKLKDKYLNTIYLKSKNDYVSGVKESTICKLLGVPIEDTTNLKNYLRDKGLLKNIRYKQDDDIILSTEGLDYCIHRRENKIYKTIKFTGSRPLPPTGRSTFDFRYNYKIIDENDAISNPMTIIVSISFILCSMWGYETNDLEKILLQIAKDKIIEKLKEGTLNDFEQIMLLSNNSPAESPYQPQYLIDASEAEYEVEIGEKPLNTQVVENKLAASIIETRDIINAIFYQKHHQKLLLLDEERNLLDFFKPATSEEEFSHRIASLGQISRHLNIEILRKITGETDSKIKSIQLLEKLLNKLEVQEKGITNTLKFLGRIRQGYPMHTDIAGVIEGLKFFNIKYPIENYEQTWQILLTNYLQILQSLFKAFEEKYLQK